MKKLDVHSSDEEKEWLDALEAGKLDASGEVLKKKIKNPLLMTARQVTDVFLVFTCILRNKLPH